MKQKPIEWQVQVVPDQSETDRTGTCYCPRSRVKRIKHVRNQLRSKAVSVACGVGTVMADRLLNLIKIPSRLSQTLIYGTQAKLLQST